MKMECKKCGGVWVNRVQKPRQCPICHRYYPEIERKWKQINKISTPVNNKQEQFAPPKEETKQATEVESW